MVLKNPLILKIGYMNKSKMVKQLQQIQVLTQECLNALLAYSNNSSKVEESLSAKQEKHDNLDFSSSSRAFLKKYCKKMSGPKKFVLLLSYLAKGSEKTSISTNNLEKEWNKITTMLGKYNAAYSVRAKEYDWVVSSKYGDYQLRPNWKDIFK